MSSEKIFKTSIFQKLKIILLLLPLSIYILLKALYNRLTLRYKTPSYKKGDDFDVVCISHVWWECVWQRNHHTMTQLSKKHKVLYCVPEIAHVIIKNPDRSFSFKPKEIGNIVYYRPLKLSGETRFNFIYKINKFILETELKKLMHKYNFKRSVLWFYFPWQENIVGSMDELLTLYDIQDDYAAFAWAPKNMASAEMSLLKKADLIFTGTDALREKNKQYNSNIHFFPCGVEFDHFAQKDVSKIPDDIKDVPHPILGYFGLIDNRIDSELIEYMATMHKDWSVFMIGPVDVHLFKKPDLKNVYFVGQKNYKLLPYYLQLFDVCLMPFAMNELTQKINPTKTLEYFASGKPVVSSAIPDMIKYYSNVMGIAYSKEEFVKLCEEALSGSEKFNISKGIEIAKSYSWETMVNNMEEIIKKEIEKKSISIIS